MMNNPAGRVIFDHEAHAGKLNIECRTCHHDALKSKEAGQNCKTCHGVEFGESFRGHSSDLASSTCVTCHHMTLTPRSWGHSLHAKKFNLTCTVCHHGPQIEYTPQNCANCHDRRVDMGPILSLKNAVHTRCASCHTKSFKDGDMTSCVRCHTAVVSRDAQTPGRVPASALVPCATCHDTEPSRLVPGSMAAYHGLCLGCHKQQGGPVENCAQCHTK